MDYTLLANNSATLFVKFLRKEGKVGLGALLNTLYWVARYKLNLIDFERLALRETRKLAGQSEAEMIELCDRWFAEMVVHEIYPEARELVEQHRKSGDVLVLLSAATVYLVRPLARHLKIEHYLCNRLEVDAAGKFTGGLVRPLCYGDGKMTLARDFAARQGVELARSYHYTDSITDLPSLLGFGEPRVVNPDPLLKKEARRRGWPVLNFKRS